MSDPHALLFALDERPPPGKSLTAAVAHLLAIVGGIATAPLIIARGLNLDVGQTTYLVAAAFTVSGIATFVQVYRFGHLGSGLLSVQGTSFAFVGVFIYAGLQLQADHTNAEVVGILLGTSAAGGIFTMAASFVLQRLSTIITLNVAGIVIFLLGLSLVQVAFANLNAAASQAAGMQSMMVWVQAGVVVACIAFLSSRNNPWVKLSSICAGLMLGVAFAFATGGLDRSLPELTRGVALLQLAPFPLGFDPIVFLLLLPIFLVTITESIGDLTATSLLSGCSVQGNSYWQRIRGGVMADGFNTTLAAMFGTFPNTTFSQNNGVIRLTGVASRYVGMILAGLLVLLGSVPLVSAVFQVLPGGVLHGATGLMFAMIMFAGLRILRAQPDLRRTMTMLVICTAGALALTQSGRVSGAAGVDLPDYVLILTNFPVATGAVLAMLWELLAPARAQPAELS